MAGEYTGEVVLGGVAKWIEAMAPHGRSTAGRVHRAIRVAHRAEEARRRAARRGRARAPAGVLRRLPRAPGVLGDEAARARDGRLPRLGRHRLPHLLDAAALQHRQHRARLRPGARFELGDRADVRRAHRHHHGRRRLLAQRSHLGNRQRRVQQGRRHPGHHEERLHLGDRHAEHSLLAPPDRVEVGRHEHRARARRASASSGSSPSTPIASTRWRRRCARR